MRSQLCSENVILAQNTKQSTAQDGAAPGLVMPMSW